MLENGYIKRIPPRVKKAIDLWVRQARPCGHFVTACLENNLHEAIGRADENSYRNIDAIVGYLYNECPSPCWGSKAKVNAWAELLKERAARAGN